MYLKPLLVLWLSLSVFSLNAQPEKPEQPQPPREDVQYRRAIVYVQQDQIDIEKLVSKTPLAGFTLFDKAPDKIEKPYYRVEALTDFNTNYPVPNESYLSYFGRGLSQTQVALVAKTKLALIFDFVYPDSYLSEGLIGADRYVGQTAKALNGFIWDSQTRELFTAQSWKQNRSDAWFKGIPLIKYHTVLHPYQTEYGYRAITLGMEKFGLPDIVVSDFRWSQSHALSQLITLVGQSLVEGNFPDDNNLLTLNIKGLRNSPYKTELLNSLEQDAQDKVVIGTKETQRQDGDPDNYLLALTFDTFKGADVYQKQILLLADLLGRKNKISYVKHTQQLEAASQNAKAKLNDVKKRFNQGLPSGEIIKLKAPFETAEGGREWMWIEVIKWQNDSIKGELLNQPRNIPSLELGATVTVKQADIFDYLHTFADGSSEGNETGKLIQAYQN